MENLLFLPHSTTKPSDYCAEYNPPVAAPTSLHRRWGGGAQIEGCLLIEFVFVTLTFLFPHCATLATADSQRGGPHPTPESEQESDRKKGDLKGRDQDLKVSGSNPWGSWRIILP